MSDKRKHKLLVEGQWLAPVTPAYPPKLEKFKTEFH